jgi:hypothetical protein
MATINTNVLNSVFEDYLTEEINREATLLKLIKKRPERKNVVQWAINVGGASATGVAISASAPSSSNDTAIPASLPINANSFQTAFGINAKEVEESAVLSSQEELRDNLRALLSTAVDEMMNAINIRLYTGEGLVADGGIYGLSTAVSSKDYAGVSSTTYPIWKASEIDLWDTTSVDTDKRQALTTDALYRMERLIRTKGGRFDLIVTTPKVLEQYKRIFDTKRDYFVMVTADSGRVPLADLGFGVGGFAGVPIIDDPFCQRTRNVSGNDASATTALGTDVDDGVMYFLRSADLEFLSVPTMGSRQASGVFTQMELMGKTGLYIDKYVVGCIPQLVLKTRKNSGIIKNILVDA